MPDQIPRKIPAPLPDWKEKWDVKFSLDPQPAFLTPHSFQEFEATKSGDFSKEKLIKMCMEDIAEQEEEWTTGASPLACVMTDLDTSPDPTITLALTVVRYNIEFTAYNPEEYWDAVEAVVVNLEWEGFDDPLPMRWMASFNNVPSCFDTFAEFANCDRPTKWSDEEILTLQPTWQYPSIEFLDGLIGAVYCEPNITLEVHYAEIESQEDYDYFFAEEEDTDGQAIDPRELLYAQTSTPPIPLVREEEE